MFTICVVIFIGFGLAVYSVMEIEGSVQYSLVFVGWLEREITITVTAVDGTAECELCCFCNLLQCYQSVFLSFC